MKVILGLSGGVDSAVAARLLQKQGLEVIGLYMDNGFPGAEAAQAVAEYLRIPLLLRDARADMEKHVCAPFVESYLRGETPNPCILCNPAVKFRLLLEAAKELGAEYIATGHYAVAREGGLYKGHPENDQSYMLCRLTKEQIQHLLLPLGPYPKSEVRLMAGEMDLPVANKPDSMEICFIPDKNYAAYIEQRGIIPPPGDFILDGKPAARHKGIHHYTVGQRKHFGIGFGKRVYVSAIDPKTNRVYLSDDDDVWADTVPVRDVNWLIDPPTAAIECNIRIRHSRKVLPPALVTPEGNGVLIRFPQPVRAPTPGQSAAIYWDDRLIGGGFISKP